MLCIRSGHVWLCLPNQNSSKWTLSCATKSMTWPFTGVLLPSWCYIFSIYSNVWKLSSSFMESFRGKNWPYSSLWEIHGHIFSFHLYGLAYACTLHLMSPQFESYFKQQGIEQIAFLIFLTFLIWIPLQRFGTALVPWGQLHLKNKQYATDFEPINRDCGCLTCKHYTRAYINCLLGREEVACHLLTLHNIYYQVSYRRLQYLFINSNSKSVTHGL